MLLLHQGIKDCKTVWTLIFYFNHPVVDSFVFSHQRVIQGHPESRFCAAGRSRSQVGVVWLVTSSGCDRGTSTSSSMDMEPAWKRCILSHDRQLGLAHETMRWRGSRGQCRVSYMPQMSQMSHTTPGPCVYIYITVSTRVAPVSTEGARNFSSGQL